MTVALFHKDIGRNEQSLLDLLEVDFPKMQAFNSEVILPLILVRVPKVFKGSNTPNTRIFIHNMLCSLAKKGFVRYDETTTTLISVHPEMEQSIARWYPATDVPFLDGLYVTILEDGSTDGATYYDGNDWAKKVKMWCVVPRPKSATQQRMVQQIPIENI